jgi:cell division protein ZapA
MERRVAQVRVGGQSYKVVSSAPEGDLHRLAAMVDAKIAEVTPRGRPVAPNAVLLAAIALAHDVEEERARRLALEERAKDVLRRSLVRIDGVLGGQERAR